MKNYIVLLALLIFGCTQTGTVSNIAMDTDPASEVTQAEADAMILTLQDEYNHKVAFERCGGR